MRLPTYYGAIEIAAANQTGREPVSVRMRHRSALATGAWTRCPDGWTSDNGWTVRRRYLTVPGEIDGYGWVAYAPDGYPSWWAHDPVTAMERAEARP